MVDYRGGYKWV